MSPDGVYSNPLRDEQDGTAQGGDSVKRTYSDVELDSLSKKLRDLGFAGVGGSEEQDKILSQLESRCVPVARPATSPGSHSARSCVHGTEAMLIRPDGGLVRLPQGPGPHHRSSGFQGLQGGTQPHRSQMCRRRDSAVCARALKSRLRCWWQVDRNSDRYISRYEMVMLKEKMGCAQPCRLSACGAKKKIALVRDPQRRL